MFTDDCHSLAAPAASGKCSSVREVEPSPAGSTRQHDKKTPKTKSMSNT